MLKGMSLIISLSSLLLILGFTYYNYYYHSKPSYLSTKVCSIYHKKEDVGQQLKIWESSKHSQAYKVLTTEKAG